jgi:Protein of unknown function (DUF3108)
MVTRILESSLKSGHTLVLSLLLALSALFCSQGLVAATNEPRLNLVPHKAEYQARIKKGISLDGKATRELSRREDGSWLYRFDVSTTPADILESSILQISENALQPLRYDYNLTGMFIKDRKQQVDFDWANGKLAEKYKKKSWELPVNVGTQDRLSYQLQLQLDISNGKEHFTYQVIHKGQIRQYDFTKVGEETIETSIGSRDAIVITKDRDPGKDRQTTLWFDKGQPNILLRMIQVEDDGETYEINISNLSL